jgi:hypothetical protein
MIDNYSVIGYLYKLNALSAHFPYATPKRPFSIITTVFTCMPQSLCTSYNITNVK